MPVFGGGTSSLWWGARLPVMAVNSSAIGLHSLSTKFCSKYNVDDGIDYWLKGLVLGTSPCLARRDAENDLTVVLMTCLR